MTKPIPTQVETQVRHAIATLRQMQDALTQGANLDRQFGGDGRYTADAIQNRWGNVPNLFVTRNEALGVIRWFRAVAPRNGVDAHATLASWGYDPKMAELKVPDAVKEWLPSWEGTNNGLS